MDHDHKLEEKYEGLMPDAIIFAFNAHSGQYRKVAPHQYIIHPLRVSEFLLKNFKMHPSIESMRVVAVLHDTIEDTWVTEKEIEAQFGKKIAKIVVELSKPELSDKKERHKLYLKALENGSDESKIIKLADIFDNVILSLNNEAKWLNFLLESKEILEHSKLEIHNDTYEQIKKDLLQHIDGKIKIISEKKDEQA